MFSIKIYLGCHYRGMNRQNICKILFGNRARSVLDERLKALWGGGRSQGDYRCFQLWLSDAKICFQPWLSDAKIWVMDAALK